jgi:hypothetical protein
VVHVAMAKGGFAHGKTRALVGERGPEIVDLPPGARVHSNSASRRMARTGGPSRGLQSLNRIFPEHGLGEPGFQMSFNAVRRVFEASGADPRTAYIFATIAKGESSFHPGIRGDDPGGTKGWGLVQNTPGVWSRSSKTYKLMQRLGGEAALRNPFVNAKVALSLLSEGGWDNWYGTRYKHDPGSGVSSALTRGDRAFMAAGLKGSAGMRRAKGKAKRPPGLQRTGPGGLRRGGFGDQFRQRGGPKNRDVFRQMAPGLDKISEQFRLPLALAGLTESTADDLAILKQQEGALSHSLGVNLRNGNKGAAADLAEALASTRDSIESLEGAVNDSAEQQKAATEAHTAAVQQHVDQMKVNEQLIRAQGPALIAGLVHFANFGIGTSAGSARQFPSSAGLGGLFRA